MKKKRIICAVTALALMLGLPGCGAGNVSAALDIVSGAVDDMRELEPTPEPVSTPAATAAPTPEPTPEPTPVSRGHCAAPVGALRAAPVPSAAPG